MKFNSSSLFLAAMALVSASVSTAEDTTESDESDFTKVPNSSGCSEGFCWTSCIVENAEGEKINEPDPTTAWEEGGNWCWLQQSAGFASCDEGCTADQLVMWCDEEDENACSPH